MHDYDRTLLETEWPTAFEPPDQADSDGALSPAEELELASELLEVSSDEELEEFLGELISRATRAVTNFARSKTGRALGHMLGSAFKKIEPIANQALDAYIQGRASRAGGGGGGDEGGGGGGGAASALTDVAEDVAADAELPPGPDIGQLLGLELEGLSPEDRDFEVCRQLVRLASSAAQQASLAPPQANPDAVAQQAITAAASEYAPGLLEQANGSPGGASPRSGRWVRRGRTITLYGIYGPAAKSAANGGQAS